MEEAVVWEDGGVAVSGAALMIDEVEEEGVDAGEDTPTARGMG